MSGAHSRNKGHGFERDIANAYRQRWPHLATQIRRSQQAHQAHEPDVVVPDWPVWTECYCGAKPNPLAKLAQAEADVEQFSPEARPWPVVVWRKSGDRTVKATMRLGALLATTGWSGILDQSIVVTVNFEEWLASVSTHVQVPEESKE